MPYRIDPVTGQPVWDGTSIPQASRDSLGTQIRELQNQIDNLSFIDLDDAPTSYTGQAGKIVAVNSAEDGLEFIVDGGGGGGVSDGDKGDVVVSSSGTVWTLDTSGVTAGSYTLLSATIDAKGRITAASNGTAGTVTDVTIASANGISGESSGGATPSLTLELGAITPTSVNGVTITNGGSGALTVTSTASVSGSNTGDVTLDGTSLGYLTRTNQVLTASAINLASHVTGTLPIGNGGTGASTAANARTNLELGGAALLAVGTTTGTVAAGDDARFHSAASIGVTLQSVMDFSGQDLVAVTAPPADRIVFFDQSEGSWEYLEVGSGLSISGQTLTASGSGDVVGPSSSTDNAIARFNGTGGKTLQDSSIVIDDAQISPTPAVCIKVVQSLQTNSAFVACPMGNGAFIVGPAPDGLTTGGNARGTNAVDLQMTRTNVAHVASGASSLVGAGAGNAATASNSATVGGIANQATAAQAVAHGSRAISNRLNMMAHGNAAANGECQAGRVIMRRTTTDATPVPLSMDGAAPSGSTITTSTHFILNNNQAVFADIRVVARSASGVDHAAYMRRVLIKRDANAASTAIIGTVLSPTADIESAGAAGWEVAITADTTNGGMLITVTGAAATTIVWGASVEFMEIIRA